MTFLFLILRILSNPFANAFQKKIVLKDSAILSNFYVYFLLSMCCLPFMLNIQWFNLTPSIYYHSAIAGILCSVGTVCLIKALEMGELSVLGPINSYKCIIGLISAFFIMGEVPHIIGLAGMFLVIYGSKFIFDTTDEGFSLKLLKRRDIQLRFMALILSGTEAGILKKVIALSSPEICFYLWCFWGAVFSFVIVLLSGKNFKKPTVLKDYFIVAISLAIMQLSTNIVFKNMHVGLALALFQLSTLITLFLGFQMFKEKEMKKKIIGTIIMITGSIFIICFN